jgi:TRAP-type C4-dicarboxylate transport system permease small subunit
MAHGVRANTHLAVDVVTKHLGPAAQKAVALLGIALCALYVVLMLGGSFTLVRRLYTFGNLAHDIPLPRWVLLSSLPIGFALLGLRLAQAAVEVVRGTRPAGDGHAPERLQ